MKRKRGYKDKYALFSINGTFKEFVLYKICGAYEDDSGEILVELDSGDDIYKKYLSIFDTPEKAEAYYKKHKEGVKNGTG